MRVAVVAALVLLLAVLALPSNGGAQEAVSSPAGQVTLNLPVPFYRQLTAVWCDPAVIQSWYEYTSGERVAEGSPFQSTTWDGEASHNLGFTLEEWNASPYAVASALHHHMPTR